MSYSIILTSTVASTGILASSFTKVLSNLAWVKLTVGCWNDHDVWSWYVLLKFVAEDFKIAMLRKIKIEFIMKFNKDRKWLTYFLTYLPSQVTSVLICAWIQSEVNLNNKTVSFYNVIINRYGRGRDKQKIFISYLIIDHLKIT